MAEEKKNIFERALDAISTRDEKAAMEEAQAEVETMEKEASEAEAKLKGAEKEIDEAEKRAIEAEAKAKRLEAELRKMKMAQMRASFEERRKLLAKNKFIATHTLTATETLSHVALHYYGHATPPYYELIYKANKEVVGDNINHVRPGMVLRIPELPEALKDK